MELQERIEHGMQRLERSEIAIRQDVHQSQELLVRAVADIEIEMEALRAELAALEQEMQRTVARAKHVVGQYKGVVKQSDLLRIQSRVDLWAPERRISRDQFKKLLS